jgi:alkyldihydroxyacetonephosphate synthase
MLRPISISQSVIKKLQKICGEQGISVRENDRVSYGRDSSTPSLIEIREGHVSHPPDLIVWPTTTRQVSEVLKIVHENQISIVPYGAGSGVCGAAIPLKGGIVLDLKKMDKIISIDSKSQTVTAETGVFGEILERKLTSAGFTLGHFPSSIYMATLGGFLACRSAGQLSTKYGKIEDMVRAFTVCTADGRIINLGPTDPTSPTSLTKTVLDLRELFLGSEGTLGIITQATLAIHPQPEEKKYLGYRFENLHQGLTAIRRFMQQGLKPAVVRLYDPLDSLIFSMGEESKSSPKKNDEKIPKTLRPFFKSLKTYSLRTILSQSYWINRLIDLSLARSLLILGFEGPVWKVRHEHQQVTKICDEEGGENLGEAPGLHWLKNRYNAGYKMSPVIDQGCFADTMEVAAPWSRLEELYEAVRRAISDDALLMAHFSHVYPDGSSIYFTFAGYEKNEERSLALHRKIWDQALNACLEHGGTISHHHGVGSLKAKAFVQELGPLHDWFKKAKRVLDPYGILNPGKMGL